MNLADLLQLVPAIFAGVLAITLHEAAHGYAALALGDDTARRAGRLSLNPLKHVDRFGTIILPGILVISQLLLVGRIVFLFGWAKPVPIGAWKFKDPRRGMAVVAAAGPAMNFALAVLTALLLPHVPQLTAMQYLAALEQASGFVLPFAYFFILTNLVLGLFNLIPIPPLDGGRIAVGLLPQAAAAVWARLEGAGILVVILVVFLLPRLLAEFGIAFDPFGQAMQTVLPWALRLVLMAGGHHVDGDHGRLI